MKKATYSSVGVNWDIMVPETVDEYNGLAKREGNPCLDDAIDHIVFHDTLGEIRYEFAEALSKELKVERPKKDTGEKDEKGQPITKPINDGAFINLLLAQSGKKATDFPDIIKAVAEKVKFDPSASTRTGGGKEIAKQYITAATELLAMHGREVNGKVIDAGAITTSLEGLNPSVEKQERGENGLPSKEYLGRLISVNEARKRAATKLSTQYADPASMV